MEALLVGVATGVGFTLSALLWQLYVRPEVVLSLIAPRSLGEREPAPPDSRTVRALRWAVGVVVFVSGFVTGGLLAFLSVTDG